MRERAAQVVGYVCVNSDLRERKRTEEDRRLLEVKALAQSKLATLGQVATGVAHEINQPLTYINTFIQALQEDLELKDLDPERMKPRLSEALRQVSRINDIVQPPGRLPAAGGIPQCRRWAWKPSSTTPCCFWASTFGRPT